MTEIARVQTGVRMNRKLVKVLKGLAEYYDVSLGQLFEHLVARALTNDAPLDETAVKKAKQLSLVYNLTRENLHSFILEGEGQND